MSLEHFLIILLCACRLEMVLLSLRGVPFGTASLQELIGLLSAFIQVLRDQASNQGCLMSLIIFIFTFVAHLSLIKQCTWDGRNLYPIQRAHHVEIYIFWTPIKQLLQLACQIVNGQKLFTSPFMVWPCSLHASSYEHLIENTVCFFYSSRTFKWVSSTIYSWW